MATLGKTGQNKTLHWALLRLLACLVVVLSPVFVLIHPTQAASDLLAAYSFDRSSGGTFFDESGNGDDCTAPDTTHVKVRTGHTNGAISTNDSSAHATCLNNNLQPTNELTVMAWIARDDAYYEAPIVTMPFSASDDTWGLDTGNYSQGYAAYVNTTSTGVWLLSNVNISSDTSWHHIAMTYDGTTAKLYMDGALVDSQALSGPIDYSGTFPLELFTDVEGDDFQGSIDDLRIYGTALSQLQVQTMMNTPVQNSSGNTYSRSITMSSSSPSATNVTYSVGFTADTTYSLQAIIVDFCSNSPLVGQTCTKPPGFAMGSPPTVSNLVIDEEPVAGWTASSQSSGRTLVYTSSSGTAVSPGTTVTFDINGITNPSGTGSYYARILTYSFDSPSYSATSTDNFKESGQLALSTAASANFTFEVPETLSFCVYKTTCGDSPAVALGHGTPLVLDNNAVDTDSVRLSASTNAQGGVVIDMKGDTLTSGSDEIPPVDGGSGATDTTITPGTAAFGMDVPTYTDFFVNYCYRGDGTSTGYYCLYDQGASAGIRRSGAEIISSSVPLDNATATLTFAATASPTTPSGQYTATFSLVATATF